MNIKALSKLNINDLKKIDYQKLPADLRKRPELLLSLIAVLVTIITCGYTFSKYQKQSMALSAEIQQMEKKQEAIKGLEASQKEFNEFISHLPENINEDTLFKRLTDFAESRNIHIASVSPGQRQSLPLYDLSSLHLDIIAKSYPDLWLFFHDVEHSSYALRVEKWTGQLNQSQRTSREEPSLGVQVEVVLINFKKDLSQ